MQSQTELLESLRKASQEFFNSCPITIEDTQRTLEAIAKKRNISSAALEYYIDCVAFGTTASNKINESIEEIFTIKETLNELTT